MNKEKLSLKLTSSVMGERQAKVYSSLLNANGSTATELHRISGVSVKKIYDVLLELCESGFCHKIKTKNKVFYHLSDPDTFFQRFLDKNKRELEVLLEIKTELDTIYKNSLPKLNEFSTYIEVIHGNFNVHKKYTELIRKTKRTILGTSCPPFAVINKKQVTEQIKTMKDFFARGGKDKTVREINHDSPAFVFNALKDLSTSAEEENRITLQCPIKLYIFDDETLMTFNSSFMQEGDELSASIIKQPNTVKTYVQMFNFLWDQAETVEDWMKQNNELLERKIIEYNKSQ